MQNRVGTTNPRRDTMMAVYQKVLCKGGRDAPIKFTDRRAR